MIRSNLIKRRAITENGIEKVVYVSLFLCLFVQLVFVGLKYSRNLKVTKESEKLQKVYSELMEESKRYRISEKDRGLAGFLIRRNRWIRERNSSSLDILARLERSLPGQISIVSFGGDANSGTIRGLSPDMQRISNWLNQVFGMNKGSLSIEGKNGKELLFKYVWSS